MCRASECEFVGVVKGADAPGKGESMVSFPTGSGQGRLVHRRIHEPCQANRKPWESGVTGLSMRDEVETKATARLQPNGGNYDA